MKYEITLKQDYSKIVRIFRGWQTAQTWIEETMLAGGPEVTVEIRALPDDPELPFSDTDFCD